MKVKELIEILEKMDQDIAVNIYNRRHDPNFFIGDEYTTNFSVEVEQTGWNYDKDVAILEVYIE